MAVVDYEVALGLKVSSNCLGIKETRKPIADSTVLFRKTNDFFGAGP
jgi:hypothetical protein